MSQEENPQTPDVVSEATSDRAAEAFALLGNETRLGIMLALWDAYEPFEADNTVSFSTLRDRVGMRDSGQFNYHLDKLTGHYIDSSQDGYELREAGHRIIQSVLAGVGIEDPSFDHTNQDFSMSCPMCGANIQFEYRDWAIEGYCPECPPREESATADRHVMSFSFDPAGVATRSVEETLIANQMQAIRIIQMRLSGVCHRCSGPVDSRFDICEDHTATDDGICDTCGRNSRVQLRLLCSVCKTGSTFPGGDAAIAHPKVHVFMMDHGMPYGYHADRAQTAEEYVALEQATEHATEVVSETPFRYEVTISHESGDKIQVVFNDDVEIVEIARSRDSTAPG